MALEEAWSVLKAGAPPPAWTRPEKQTRIQDVPYAEEVMGTEWDHGTTIESTPGLDRMADNIEADRMKRLSVPKGTEASRGVVRNNAYDNWGRPRRRRTIQVAPRPPVARGSSSIFDDDRMTTDEPPTDGVGRPWSLAEEYPTLADLAFAAESDNVRRYKAGERNLPSSWDAALNWEDPRSQ